MEILEGTLGNVGKQTWISEDNDKKSWEIW